MIRHSKQHLAATGESYGEHLRFASYVGLLAVAAGMACLIHALVPAFCTRTCSTIVARLQQLFARRHMLQQVTQQSSGAITFVGLVLIAAFATAAPIIGGASLSLATAVGTLAFAFPLAFLLTNRELDSVHAMA